MILKSYKIVIAYLLLSFNIVAQEQVNYLEHNYRHLDYNFNIIIDSKTFDEAIAKYEYYPERINKYEDSLSVVAMIEFDDWLKARNAVHQITYSWQRLAFHTWQTPEEAKALADALKLDHPWKVRKFIELEDNKNPLVVDIVKNIKVNIKNHSEGDIPNLNTISKKDLFNLAFRSNPKVMEEHLKIKQRHSERMAAYKEKHGHEDPNKIGVGCDEEDCCQKQQ